MHDPLGLRDDEPIVIRHDYRKDSKDTLATKPKAVIRDKYRQVDHATGFFFYDPYSRNSNAYDESNELRARSTDKSNESPSVTSKLDTDKLQVSKSRKCPKLDATCTRPPFVL